MPEKTVIDFHCPLCQRDNQFSYAPADDWDARSQLRCSFCDSNPRERAVSLLVRRTVPQFEKMRIHESSPRAEPREGLARMFFDLEGYVPSHYFPDTEDEYVRNFRNENLEQMSFADGSIDLHIHCDVMEHVNEPAKVLSEMDRTLAPAGVAIFAFPVEPNRTKTQRVAEHRDGEHVSLLPDGSLDYHGNPLDPSGSLVTYIYGQDVCAVLNGWWAGFDIEMVRFCSPHYGVIGRYTDVCVCRKFQR